MDDDMGIFNVLAVPLGIAMKWLYQLVQNYGWTIIIFTFVVRIVMFPLTLKQQKSTARMSAYQPMLQEIQKKWANDKNRQQQETQKFYEENNIKMSAGCAPMLINMLVLFGIIAVIQAPLNYIVQVDGLDSTTQINTGLAIVQASEAEGEDIAAEGYTQQSLLIGQMKENPEKFTTGAEVPFVDDKVYVLKTGESYKDGAIVTGDDNKVVAENATLKQASVDVKYVEAVDNFNFRFMGLNLAQPPTLSDWVTLIMPILSLLTMVASQLIMMKTSPSTQGKGQMIIMTVVFGVMFGFFAFRVPAGFSLYYTVSNLVMTLQQLLVKKIHDPEKIKAEVEAEIEERKKAKKSKKKVVVVDEATGEAIDKEIEESELVKLRLAKARELDAKKYGGSGNSSADKKDEKEDAKAKEAAEKARKLDEEKYGNKPEENKEKSKAAPAEDAEDAPDAPEAEAAEAPAGEQSAADADEAQKADEAEAGDKEYKPGRRKRASQNKQKESSFAEQELEKEQKEISEEKEGE